MFWFVASALAWAPTYTRVSVSEFEKMIWQMKAADVNHVSANQYFSAGGNQTYFVIREAGEIPTGWNSTFYYVYGTKAEIALLKEQTAVVTDNSTNIESLPAGSNVVFARFEAEANEYQLSVFWINIVVWAMIIGGVVTGLTLWHTDGYAKDPANSLLFVTDGNRLVTGE